MSTLSARERILGRLRAAAPSAILDTCDIDARIDVHYEQQRRRAALSAQQLVQSMQTALIASHAEVWCADAASWPALIAQRMAAAGVRRLLVDDACAEGAALTRALPPSVEARPFAAPIENWKAELFETVDAGFTIARSGIASTGTLIVEPDTGTPRSVSLAPPLHIALVHAHTLYPDMHSAAKTERWREGMPTNLVLVSGPSKTSDIQQTLAYGAHGPRELWVVIVTDDHTANEAALHGTGVSQ
ncbi:lactate utilization protein C [Trinickia violacea]|uniref:Lactate utilization protein C n=1 Tax=Trinickia violacea TaxID=2571746 RepID=A0A4P8ITF5_9BURK|nr:lactate utilization protein C [Trinickia violacea]QCP52392.1 lactate utilization protein C [Trinickia violacea]